MPHLYYEETCALNRLLFDIIATTARGAAAWRQPAMQRVDTKIRFRDELKGSNIDNLDIAQCAIYCTIIFMAMHCDRVHSVFAAISSLLQGGD